MDWQIIILGIGILISLILGVINLLARKEKVAVVLHESYANLVPKGGEAIGPGGKLTTVKNHSLHIYVSCALVLTSGEKEIEVMEVNIRLHKETCEELKKYFRLPNWNGFHLYKYELTPEGYRELGAILQPKKPVDFTEDRLFECTENFVERCKNVGFDLYPESKEDPAYTVPPEFIEPLLKRLTYKSQICWTRYDGKELCWRFPDKWWRNLGKKLWG